MTVLAGRYTLLEQVGEGGMSVVWRARDWRLERDVAIKLLRSFVAMEQAQRQRFEREARTLASLTNDHIVRVYDYVDTGEQAFLVLEYVEGGNLAESTFGRLPLPPAEAAAYTTPVARALAFAHRRGVVHRDLTPTNILIERESGRVLTSDFGLARIARSTGSLTAPGVLIGTPEYWSPEQALGRESNEAADLYALGCILFLLLTGRLPFEGEDRLAVGLRRAHEDAPSLGARLPAADAEVVALVDSLLVREPGLRPDAAATAAALDALAGDTDVRPAAPPAEAAAARAPTVELTADQPTPRPAAATAPTVATLPRLSARSRRPPWRGRRRLTVRVAVAAAAAAALVLVMREITRPAPRAPNVVALRESAARATIEELLPGARVSVTHVYSTRVAAGRVIRQRPKARARLGSEGGIRLIVSKGTPFAAVPAVAGVPAAVAKASLARAGFSGRYRYTPSWTTRKGSVIVLRPASGTRVRRPATVTMVVASGYPRSRVPDVQDVDLVSAQAQLAAKHLRSRVVYRLAQDLPANQVLKQIPAAGATVYRGTRVRLTVARQLRWVTLFSRSGADRYESEPFTVHRRWRIRYRLDSGGLWPLAQFSWGRDGELLGDGSFLASSGGARTHQVEDGAGTYRLAVTPYAGTSWSVAVEALE
jgi:eukaryotic-like serine/threonine-protein kinase